MSKLTILTFVAVLFCQNVHGTKVLDNPRIKNNRTGIDLYFSRNLKYEMVLFKDHYEKLIVEYYRTNLTKNKNTIDPCCKCGWVVKGLSLPDKYVDGAEILKFMDERYPAIKVLYDRASANCQIIIDKADAAWKKATYCRTSDGSSTRCYVDVMAKAYSITKSGLREMRTILMETERNLYRAFDERNSQILIEELARKVDDMYMIIDILAHLGCTIFLLRTVRKWVKSVTIKIVDLNLYQKSYISSVLD